MVIMAAKIPNCRQREATITTHHTTLFTIHCVRTGYIRRNISQHWQHYSIRQQLNTRNFFQFLLFVAYWRYFKWNWMKVQNAITAMRRWCSFNTKMWHISEVLGQSSVVCCTVPVCPFTDVETFLFHVILDISYPHYSGSTLYYSLPVVTCPVTHWVEKKGRRCEGGVKEQSMIQRIR